MPRTEKYTCDVCGSEKKETNHWMVAVLNDSEMGESSLLFMPFWRRNEASGIVSYLCGEKCVITTASRWAAAQKEATL